MSRCSKTFQKKHTNTRVDIANLELWLNHLQPKMDL